MYEEKIVMDFKQMDLSNQRQGLLIDEDNYEYKKGFVIKFQHIVDTPPGLRMAISDLFFVLDSGKISKRKKEYMLPFGSILQYDAHPYQIRTENTYNSKTYQRQHIIIQCVTHLKIGEEISEKVYNIKVNILGRDIKNQDIILGSIDPNSFNDENLVRKVVFQEQQEDSEEEDDEYVK